MSKNRHGKYNRIHLILVLSLGTFFILVFSMFFSLFVTWNIFKLGFFNEGEYITYLCFLVISVTCGVVLSRILWYYPNKMFRELGQASLRISKGDYEAKVNENYPIQEFHDMAKTFNSMATELSKSSLMKNNFISNVSHEFKTPIAAIEGYAILMKSSDVSRDDINLYSENILNNTARLTKMITNIMLLSAVENRDSILSHSRFLLDEQLREAIILFETVINQKSINLNIDMEDDCEISAHPDLLFHVWSNILSNALKFLPENGTLGVSLQQNDEFAIVSISDNGCGMSAETAERVFEKFYRGDTSGSSEGNGLGLPLAKKIVDIHHGEISFKSELNVGTEFIVKLHKNIVSAKFWGVL